MSGNQGDNKLSNARVRIITKSEIRYEGMLYQINAGEKTVALKDVYSFGSEDRLKDKFVPASDVPYEFIVFKSNEIKDLMVLKDEDKKKPSPAKKEKKPDKEEEKVEEKEPKPVEVQEEQPKPVEKKEKKPEKKTGFEFDDMLEKLNTIEQDKKDMEMEVKQYQKDDFFDDLSTSIGNKKGPRNDPYMRRNVAKETFGSVPNKTFNDVNNFNKRRNYKNHNRNNKYSNNGKRGGGYNRGGYKKNNWRGGRRQKKEENFEYVKKGD